MEASLLLRRLMTELPRFSYSFASERVLHAGLADVLSGLNIPFQREYGASPKDRLDFLVDGCVALEAKIGGSIGDAARQVERYCAHEIVQAVAIVTTERWGSLRKGVKLKDKPVMVVRVRRRFL